MTLTARLATVFGMEQTSPVAAMPCSTRLTEPVNFQTLAMIVRQMARRG
ncbi:MAG: hypothetical protein U1E76_24645 [Planctomycetota bacterium]